RRAAPLLAPLVERPQRALDGRGQVDEAAGEQASAAGAGAQRAGAVRRREDDLAAGQVDARELDRRVAVVEAGRRQPTGLAADQPAGALADPTGRLDVGGEPDAGAAAREQD